MKEPFVGQSVWYRATKKDVQAESEFTGAAGVALLFSQQDLLGIFVLLVCGSAAADWYG